MLQLPTLSEGAPLRQPFSCCPQAAPQLLDHRPWFGPAFSPATYGGALATSRRSPASVRLHEPAQQTDPA